MEFDRNKVAVNELRKIKLVYSSGCQVCLVRKIKSTNSGRRQPVRIVVVDYSFDSYGSFRRTTRPSGLAMRVLMFQFDSHCE